jgi:hypothetical protein
MLAACSSGLRPLRVEVAASEANSALVATTLVPEGELKKVSSAVRSEISYARGIVNLTA